MKIACVGVHVLDTQVIAIETVPSGPGGQLVETIRMSPAGTARGTAVVLARLGADVSSYGAVGVDPFGDSLLAMLSREGIDTAGVVRRSDEPTATAVFPGRPGGDQPAWHCIGANASFTLVDLDLAALDGITHLHLGAPESLGGEAAATLLAHARSRGATTSLDLLAPGGQGMLDGIATALPHTDYLLPNHEQVLGLTGVTDLVEGARTLLDDTGVGCVAATAGGRGAVVVSAADTVQVPAYDVEVVDTTGCDQAFSAGFLRGLSLDLEPADAAALGCAAAALVAQRRNTDRGSYDLADVRALQVVTPIHL